MAKIQENANIAYSKRGVENFSKYDRPFSMVTESDSSYDVKEGRSENFVA